jgi:hypothetical protein
MPTIHDHHMPQGRASMVSAWNLYRVGRRHRWFWVYQDMAELDSIEAGARSIGKRLLSRLPLPLELLVHEV